MSEMTVALIGGGRWGRQYASVLTQFPDRISRVLWVSRFNKPLTEAFVARRLGKTPAFESLSSLESAIRQRPNAAIVVTVSSDHAATAERLVLRGIPTLVEKPLALGGQQARRIVEVAKQRGVPLCAALHLLKADFLLEFQKLCADRRIAKMTVEWLDPESEERWGEIKTVDLTAYKAEEAIPHFWSILDMLVDGKVKRLRSVSPRSLGTAEVEVEVGSARAVLAFGRRAEARKRYLSLDFVDGGFAELDFAFEPGRATIDGVDFPLVRTDARVGPLTTQVMDFLDFVGRPRDQSVAYPQLAERCLGSVELMEAVRERLVEEEARATAIRMADGHAARDRDISAWIVDNVVPIWAAEGVRVEGTNREVADLAIESFEVADGPASGSEIFRADRISPSMISALHGSRFLAAFRENNSSGGTTHSRRVRKN